jgi:hypothetical protein
LSRPARARQGLADLRLRSPRAARIARVTRESWGNAGR